MKTSSFVLITLISIAHTRSGFDNDGLHEFDGTHSDFLNDPGLGRSVDWKAYGTCKIEEAIRRIEKLSSLHKPAKNIIFIMGDGMGISTLTAARIYLAQTRNLTGQDAKLSWEDMPHVSLSKVYSTDRQTPDSASATTAMMCGEKTHSGLIACSQRAVVGNCSSQRDNELTSVLHHAIDEGKWTGVVTTARLTHSSPACAYAHAASRDWEDDSALPEEARGVCPDISSQFIDDQRNQQIRVFLGGGRRNFIPETMMDPEYPSMKGAREDGRDLTKEWLDQKALLGIPSSKYAYVYNQSGFDGADPSHVDYLFGVFEPSHMQYELDRVSSSAEGDGEPSIAEMVEKSIKILEKSEKGYFLFVEGGRIDHAHHKNNARRALGDTVALSDAVQRALDMTYENETLVIVTADHSHAFTIGGYPALNTNILKHDDRQVGSDGKVYSTLGYINGPGFFVHRTANKSLSSAQPRRDQTPIGDLMDTIDYVQDTGIPLSSETHSGEDVAVFARGPMAHMFRGTQEQSYLGNLMMYAFCFGENKDLWNEEQNFGTCGASKYVISFNVFSQVLYLSIYRFSAFI